MLYERFFFGPPELMASNFFRIYDKEPLVAGVEAMLAREVDEADAA